MKSSFFAVLAVVAGVVSDSTFNPARPPAVPLAVRSPYLHSWLESGSDNGGSGGILPGAWPKFWATSANSGGTEVGSNGATTGWTGFIRVDNTVYTWMGLPVVNDNTPTYVTQDSLEYTSSRSTFMMDVDGKVSLNVSFVSPVTPTDLRRQSVIGSYLYAEVVSTDGAEHDVQLYSDITAEWNANNGSKVVEWSYAVEDGIASHSSWRQDQDEFNANDPDDESAGWGKYYWSTSSVDGMSYQSGADVDVRGAFISNGNLANTSDTDYRAISDNWPVFAFANDLGSVGTTPKSILYSIVHSQPNAIQFDGASGIVSVPSLWTSYFNNDTALVSFFHNDWSQQDGATDALFAADSLAAGGQDYLTITSLSARQAFAGIQLCGTIEKPYVFLKEISSDGNIQTVDVLFPSMPILLYTNPMLVKYLLDPLFENQEAGNFPQAYSIHDLGGRYPLALGHTDGGGEEMPVEECGNMLITTLAYAQRTSDTAYLAQHYNILKQWTSYLVNDSLIPDNQLSTDDFQGTLSNQTNLALKGIIGIEAMAVIADLTNNTDDATKFSSIAGSYIAQWQKFAIVTDANPPHTNLDYQDSSSSGLLYNIYGDKLLGLDLVPQSVYDMQSTFYLSIAEEYGVPLDSRDDNGKTDWEMWAAAVASDDAKSMFISKLANWINTTPVNRGFPDLINVKTGDYGTANFADRPVVGGHFALLALNGATVNATANLRTPLPSLNQNSTANHVTAKRDGRVARVFQS
ncbi:MAG: hypothetical protein M1818_005513 [Claussenomyces sp. TS43310]|nr:MAG: hypothetical protein M1818_005513 [Claussenomyces sp. TS43310]